MADLNIRDIPESLKTAIKVEAARSGMNLRGWVITVLETAVESFEAHRALGNTFHISELDIAPQPLKSNPDATEGDSTGYVEDRVTNGVRS